MDLFSLAAKLTLDSSGFNSGVASAESKGNKLVTSLNKVVSVAKKLAGVAVLGKVAKSMKGLADETAAAGDRIDKTSQKLGLSRKAFQEWDYILSQNGASVDSLGVAMKTLTNKIGSGSDAITALGLDLKEVQSISTEDAFSAIVTAFQQLPDGAEKSALAIELFGKQGQELMPLLNGTAEGTEALRQKFHDLGLEMTDDQIDAAVNYTDAMDTLTRTFDAIKQTIGAELLPKLTEWATGLANIAGTLLKAYKEDGLLGVFGALDTMLGDMATNLRDTGNPVFQLFADIIDGIREAVEIAVGLLSDFDGTVKKLKASDSVPLVLLGSALGIVKDILDWVREHKDVVVTAVTAIIGAFAVAKIVSFVAALSPVKILLAAIAAVATLIITNWEPISEFFTNLWNDVSSAVSDAWKEVVKWWTGIAQSISNAWGTIASWFNTTVWTPLKTFFTTAWDEIKLLWENIPNLISSAWTMIATWFDTTVWTPLKSFFTAAWDEITKLWTGIAGSISAAWTTIAGWFNTTVWTPLKDFFTTAWDEITKLWTGIAGLISGAWTTIATWFNTTVWKPITDFFTSMWNEVTKLWTGIAEAISGAWTTIASWFNTTVWTPIKDFFAPMWDEITKLWTGIATAISGAWTTIATWFDTTVWTPISDFFTTMWSNVQSFWDDPLGSISSAWSGVSKWISENVTGPIIGFFEDVLTSITNAINGLLEFLGLQGSASGDGRSVLPPSIDETALRQTLSTMTNDQANAFLATQGLTYNPASDTFGFAHAKGAWNIPYDDYFARLHRGEMVLTASQARQYREGSGNGDVVSAIQGLRNDLNNLKLVIGKKAFGEAVVDYGGHGVRDYIGSAESDTAYGYGT